MVKYRPSMSRSGWLWFSRAYVVLRNATLASLALIILASALSRFDDARRIPAARSFIEAEASFERPAVGWVRRTLPTRVRGQDLSRWYLLAALYLLWNLLDAAAARLRRAAAPKPAVSREALLERYADARRKLEAHRRPLAFLSIDVVESTKMKLGEDPAVVERDFRQYKRLVDRTLRQAGAWKATWTPDGVMCCFYKTEAAVEAAKAVLLGLDRFNRETKSIRGDFRVRCGIHAGPVLCDDETPMEEMTDRVIDVAGHMQKYGSVNAVAITAAALSPLGEAGFAPSVREVDGFAVCEWTPAAPVAA